MALARISCPPSLTSIGSCRECSTSEDVSTRFSAFVPLPSALVPSALGPRGAGRKTPAERRIWGPGSLSERIPPISERAQTQLGRVGTSWDDAD
jgi:hypothetical protein